MKKFLFITLGIFLTLALTGCSNDDENLSDPSLWGTWIFQPIYSTEYPATGETVITFVPGSNNTLKVSSPSIRPLDRYFMPSGTYSYQLSSYPPHESTLNMITINGTMFHYKIKDDVLDLYYDTETSTGHQFTFTRYNP